MTSETTNDYSYCWAIVRYQLDYADKCPVQAVQDYPHGAPIALFTMLWVEGYLNHLIQRLFPDIWCESQRFFKGQYAGIKGKFKFLQDELALDIKWPEEVAALLRFRNRVCHSRSVERDLSSTEESFAPNEFVDDFNLTLGTISNVRRRVEVAANFLEELHNKILAIPNDVVLKQIACGRCDFDATRVGHPIFSVLAIRSS